MWTVKLTYFSKNSPIDHILIIHLECIRSESYKYSMGQKNGLHAFGYNSAESEPIRIKVGILWAKW